MSSLIVLGLNVPWICSLPCRSFALTYHTEPCFPVYSIESMQDFVSLLHMMVMPPFLACCHAQPLQAFVITIRSKSAHHSYPPACVLSPGIPYLSGSKMTKPVSQIRGGDLTCCRHSIIKTCLSRKWKDLLSCDSSVLAVLAALVHCAEGHSILITITLMSPSTSALPSSVPLTLQLLLGLLYPRCITLHFKL